jgi:hypothetical protein
MMADGGETKPKFGYIAMYKGKKIELYANSKYEALLKAAKILNAKKDYDVSVYLAEVDGKPYVNTLMAKGGEIYGGFKIKVDKKTSPYNKDYNGIEVKVDKDGVPLKYVLQALVDFKDKAYLDKAFETKNVQVFVKMYTRYVPLGNISKNTYEKYVDFIKNPKSEGEKMEFGGVMALGGMMAMGGMLEHGFRDGDNILEIYKGYGIVENNNNGVIEILNPNIGTRFIIDLDDSNSSGMRTSMGMYKSEQIESAKKYIDYLNEKSEDKILRESDKKKVVDESGSIDSFANGGELKRDYLVTFDHPTDEYQPTTFQSTSVYDLMETLKQTIPENVEILSIEEMKPYETLKYGGVAGY